MKSTGPTQWSSGLTNAIWVTWSGPIQIAGSRAAIADALTGPIYTPNSSGRAYRGRVSPEVAARGQLPALMSGIPPNGSANQVSVSMVTFVRGLEGRVPRKQHRNLVVNQTLVAQRISTPQSPVTRFTLPQALRLTISCSHCLFLKHQEFPTTIFTKASHGCFSLNQNCLNYLSVFQTLMQFQVNLRKRTTRPNLRTMLLSGARSSCVTLRVYDPGRTGTDPAPLPSR